MQGDLVLTSLRLVCEWIHHLVHNHIPDYIFTLIVVDSKVILDCFHFGVESAVAEIIIDSGHRYWIEDAGFWANRVIKLNQELVDSRVTCAQQNLILYYFEIRRGRLRLRLDGFDGNQRGELWHILGAFLDYFHQIDFRGGEIRVIAIGDVDDIQAFLLVY